MECPVCQNTIPDTTQFCAYCGATINEPEPKSGPSKWWFIVGAAVVAVVAVVAVFLVIGGDEDLEQPQVFQQEPVPATIPARAPNADLTMPRATRVPAIIANPPPTLMATAPPLRAEVSPAQAPTAVQEMPAVMPSEDTIVFSELDWKSARVQTRIAQYIVEHGYGYSTDLMQGGTNHLFQNLRDGSSHVSMEIWLPTQADDWGVARANGEVEFIGVSLDPDWQSTFVIPKYLQEEYPGLDHVDDLKDRRYRELFANASTGGKARLMACVIGWACQDSNDSQIDGYGLTDHLQVVRPDSEDALFNDVYRAYAKQDPWLGYMWGMADPSLLLDLVRLEETPYNDECWFTHRACAFEDNTILVAVHSGLPGRAPEVYDFLTYWDFTTAEYQSVLLWMEDNGATEEQAAYNWLANGGGEWKAWVTSDAVGRIMAALNARLPALGWPAQ